MPGLISGSRVTGGCWGVVRWGGGNWVVDGGVLLGYQGNGWCASCVKVEAAPSLDSAARMTHCLMTDTDLNIFML